MTWPTTRRHPRTLAEAFPDVRSVCIELPRRRITSSAAERWERELLAIVGACAAGRIGTVTHLQAMALVSEMARDYADFHVDDWAGDIGGNDCA